MSGNTPDVSRIVFNETKRYFGRRYQQGKELFDWDVNEDWDELLWWQTVIFRELFGGDSGGMSSGSKTAFHMTELIGLNTNNVAFYHGLALVKGRPVFTQPLSGSFFIYDDMSGAPENYILKGTVTSIVTTTPTSNYDVLDTEKEFVTNHGLGGSATGRPARVQFTSGLLSNQVFDVNSSPTDTSFNVLADLSALVVGDTYVLLPPALETPVVGIQTDTMHLVVWLEDVSEIEDTDLLDTALFIAPSHRRELRWMMYADWPGADTANITEGFLSVTTGSIIRSAGAGASAVDAADLVNWLTPIRDLSYLYNASIFSTENNYINTKQGFEANAFGGVKCDFPQGTPTYAVGNFNYKSGYLDNVIGGRFAVELSNVPSLFSSPGNKTFGINIDTTGSLATTTQFASNDILEKELALVTSHVDASNDIVRTMRMGERGTHVGFNWRVDSTTDVTIFPGERFCWGSMLQLSAPITISTSTASISTPLPTDEWLYLYLAKKKTVANDFRSLIGFFDTRLPNWDGTHSTPINVEAIIDSDGRAFCIGAVYLDGSSNLKDAYCTNNTMYFRESLADPRGLLLYNSPIVNAIGNLNKTNVDLPNIVSEVGLEIEYTDITVVATPFPQYKIESRQGGIATIWSQQYNLPLISSSEKGVMEITFPANIGDSLNATQLNAATMTTQLALRWAKFNPLYMYDNFDWSQD